MYKIRMKGAHHVLYCVLMAYNICIYDHGENYAWRPGDQQTRNLIAYRSIYLFLINAKSDPWRCLMAFNLFFYFIRRG